MYAARLQCVTCEVETPVMTFLRIREGIGKGSILIAVLPSSITCCAVDTSMFSPFAVIMFVVDGDINTMLNLNPI